MGAFTSRQWKPAYSFALRVHYSNQQAREFVTGR